MQIKKYLMAEQEREEFTARVYTLEFRYTISRGRDTYGQNICSLWLNSRVKAASCTGGNFDMRGTCLGQFIREYFPEHLKKARAPELYGLTFWDDDARKCHKVYHPGDRILVDGGCGFCAMEKILRRLGFYLGNPVKSLTNSQTYKLSHFTGSYGKMF